MPVPPRRRRPRQIPQIPEIPEAHWIDVWAHLPDELTEHIRRLAMDRRASLLDIIETLLWMGLLRHEEVRRRSRLRRVNR